MRTINFFSARILKNFSSIIFILSSILLTLSSCSRSVKVKEAFPFEFNTLPFVEDLANGEQIELRCELSSQGTNKDTRYRIRFFQFKGSGELRLFFDNGEVMKPNDYYPIGKGKFSLWYTSRCNVAQSLEIVIEDQYGSMQKLSMELQASEKNSNGSGDVNGNANTNSGKTSRLTPAEKTKAQLSLKKLKKERLTKELQRKKLEKEIKALELKISREGNTIKRLELEEQKEEKELLSIEIDIELTKIDENISEVVQTLEEDDTEINIEKIIQTDEPGINVKEIVEEWKKYEKDMEALKRELEKLN